MRNTILTLASLALLVVSEAALAQSCDQAWSNYNEFKRRNTMEPAQYPLTSYGAAVRAACGPQALPVPPGSDTPRRPIVRQPLKPPPGPTPPAAVPVPPAPLSPPAAPAPVPALQRP